MEIVKKVKSSIKKVFLMLCLLAVMGIGQVNINAAGVGDPINVIFPDTDVQACVVDLLEKDSANDEINALDVANTTKLECPPYYHYNISDLSGVSVFENLTEIRVVFNNLTTLPTELNQLTMLEILDVGGNKFTTFPSVIFEIPSLKELSIRYHQNITELPAEIANLTNLEELDMHEVGLYELPNELATLNNLKSLSFSYSNVSEIPTFIYGMTSLEHLDIAALGLKEISPDLANLTNLTRLSVADNYLVELPDELGALVNLEDLIIFDNQITHIPDSYQNLVNLNNLWQLWNLFEEDANYSIGNDSGTFTLQRELQIKPDKVNSEYTYVSTMQKPDHSILNVQTVNEWESEIREVFSNAPLDYTNFTDMDGNPLDISEYVDNDDNIIKEGKVKAQIKRSNTTWDNAVSDDYVILNLVIKADVNEGVVIVKFVDTDDREIAKQQQLTGEVGTEYETKAKEIAGYELKTTPKNATGVFSDEEQSVVYIYQKVDQNDDDEQPDPDEKDDEKLPDTGQNELSYLLGVMIATIVGSIAYYRYQRN